MTSAVVAAARIGAADLQRGRGLSLAADADPLFYHGGGCLLGNELDGLGRLVVGEIESGRGVVSLPRGWYRARDLWPQLFPGSPLDSRARSAAMFPPSRIISSAASSMAMRTSVSLTAISATICVCGLGSISASFHCWLALKRFFGGMSNDPDARSHEFR